MRARARGEPGEKWRVGEAYIGFNHALTTHAFGEILEPLWLANGIVVVRDADVNPVDEPQHLEDLSYRPQEKWVISTHAPPLVFCLRAFPRVKLESGKPLVGCPLCV